MILALLLLLPLTAFVVWGFFRTSPPAASGVAVRRFNVVAVGLALIVVVAWDVHVYRAMTATPDAAWWPVIATLGTLAGIALVLLLAGLLRNLLLFRRHGHRHGR